jgi:hypothetical protein
MALGLYYISLSEYNNIINSFRLLLGFFPIKLLFKRLELLSY